MPLLKTKWLCKKDNKRVLLKVEPNGDKTGPIFSVLTGEGAEARAVMPLSAANTTRRSAPARCRVLGRHAFAAAYHR